MSTALWKECPVCLKRFGRRSQATALSEPFGCAHSMCCSCLAMWSFSCPTCRKLNPIYAGTWFAIGHRLEQQRIRHVCVAVDAGTVVGCVNEAGIVDGVWLRHEANSWMLLLFAPESEDTVIRWTNGFLKDPAAKMLPHDDDAVMIEMTVTTPPEIDRILIDTREAGIEAIVEYA